MRKALILAVGAPALIFAASAAQACGNKMKLDGQAMSTPVIDSAYSVEAPKIGAAQTVAASETIILVPVEGEMIEMAKTEETEEILIKLD